MPCRPAETIAAVPLACTRIERSDITTMMLHKLRVAPAATLLAALAAVSAVDSASPQSSRQVPDDDAVKTELTSRAAVSRVVRNGDGGLVAISSDAPEGLRAKRRDLANEGVSRAAGGGSSQDKPAFGA